MWSRLNREGFSGGAIHAFADYPDRPGAIIFTLIGSELTWREGTRPEFSEIIRSVEEIKAARKPQ